MRWKEIVNENLNEAEKPVWWHGSASGDLRGGATGLHVGSHEAAKQALEARIGVPAEGEWDGSREYGKTKLAGKRTMKTMGHFPTGHNTGAPEDDYYPHEHPQQKHVYPNGEVMPDSVKPSIRPYHITGPMSNTPHAPHEDFKANGYMKAALKKGNAKRGYYYKNDGEDAGSISAVVPNGNHLAPALGEEEQPVAERAPHSKKGEDFVKKHKAEFKDRYGKRWKQVLYATAWKLFGE